MGSATLKPFETGSGDWNGHGTDGYWIQLAGPGTAPASVSSSIPAWITSWTLTGTAPAGSGLSITGDTSRGIALPPSGVGAVDGRSLVCSSVGYSTYLRLAVNVAPTQKYEIAFRLYNSTAGRPTTATVYDSTLTTILAGPTLGPDANLGLWVVYEAEGPTVLHMAGNLNRYQGFVARAISGASPTPGRLVAFRPGVSGLVRLS